MNPILALIIANIIWGAASPIFKLSLQNIPPFTLAFIRFFFAAILLIPFIIHKWQKLTFRQYFEIMVASFFGISVNISFFFLALPKTASINAPIIASGSPIILFFLSILFLKERFRMNVFRGILISFLGVLIIIFSPLLMDGALSMEAKETAFEGNLFLVIATFGSVMHALVFKKVLKTVWHIQASFISFFVGSVSFMPFMIPELSRWSFTLLDYRGWVGIVFGVFLSSALAYALYIYGISKIHAQEIGIFTYIDPVVAVVLAIPLLGEYPSFPFFAGSLLVFLGIVFAEGRLQRHPVHRIKG